MTDQDGSKITIADLSNELILGTITTLDSSPFEIVLAPDQSKVYVTNAGRGEDAINILDVAATSAVQRVGVGSTPIEIALLPNGSKLYTADFLGGTVSVVDTATGTRVATIPTASSPYDVTASPDGTRVYATSLGSTDVFVIDTVLDTVVDRIPVGRDFLGHLAITPDGRKAYLTEFRDRVTVIDLASNSIIGSIQFNAAEANPNNGALDITIDPGGDFAYVLGFDSVNVIDLSTDTLADTIHVGIQLSDVATDSTGAFVYATTLYQTIPLVDSNEIVKIDARDRTIKGHLVVGGLPIGLAVANVNQTPLLDPIGTRSGQTGVPMTFMVTGADPDGDPISLQAVGLPQGASFDQATGHFAWTPSNLQAGTHQVTFSATDSGSPPLTAEETVSIVISASNNDSGGGGGGGGCFVVGTGLPDGLAVLLGLGGIPLGCLTVSSLRRRS